MIFICPTCLQANPSDRSACGQCGRDLSQVPRCVRCGATHFDFSLFCYSCGVLLPAKTAPSDSSQTEPDSDPTEGALIELEDLATAFHGKRIQLFHRASTRFLPLPAMLEVVVIGKRSRSFNPDIDLYDFPQAEFISRSHAQIYLREQHYYIEDLDSKNGTEINGVSLLGGRAQLLNFGDLIRLGRSEAFTFIFIQDQPINLEHIQMISGEDADFEVELLTSFLSSVTDLLKTVEQSLYSSDFMMIKTIAGQIAITSYNVGADIINLLSKQLEDQALQQSDSACRRTLALLNEGLIQVRLFRKVFYGDPRPD
jgi:HPt (histidine-containing phosphotransfer) domain-containing protein